MTKYFYEINQNGISIIIPKEEGISDQIYYKQYRFIIKQKDLISNYDYILKLSKMYVNMHFRKCKYNSNIADEILLRDSV